MAAGKSYRALIISIHPEWWERMRAGEKLLEVKEGRPRGSGPYTVLVCVEGGVVGELVCDCFYRREEYAKDGGKPLWGWHITRLKEYAQPISLPEVGVKKAPQSWSYLR